MVEIVENILIGDSHDGFVGHERMLNVAQDLKAGHGWPGCEYMQVGLVDGPGNSLCTYYAAVLALAGLIRCGPGLVYCHTGGRSLAVVLMYIHLITDLGWDGCLAFIHERIDAELPTINDAHADAFKRMDWATLRKLANGVLAR